MIVIIDYNAGNVRSVQRACGEIGVCSMATSDPTNIISAKRIIFPGIGAAVSAMDYMREMGLDIALRHACENGIPILGICLGAQIILDSSEEGDLTCLGLVPGKALRFKLQDKLHKIPHMGWNKVEVVQSHPLLDGIKEGDEFYFAHSFYPQPAEEATIFAVTEYEKHFSSALGCRNLFATQFHPEKSGPLGLQLLERFAKWDGVIPDKSAERRGQ